MKKSFETIAVVLIAVPVLGILMGGVYSLPAMYVTKERDPWLTLLLGVGLAITVFGIGYAAHVPPQYLGAVWFVSVLLLLLARAVFGGLGHNLERFGMVHMATLCFLFLVLVIARRATSRNAYSPADYGLSLDSVVHNSQSNLTADLAPSSLTPPAARRML